MITVYVESNFVLELVLEQQESEFCQRILDLSSQQKIKLILPAYSLVEPNEKLIRQARQRKKVHDDFKQELKQLNRTESYKEDIESIYPHLDKLLINSQEKERESFQRIQQQLIDTGEIIPLNPEIIKKIREENIEECYKLSPQDAVVFGSILNHLENNPSNPSATSYFLNKNKKDFADNPSIKPILLCFNCEIISNFEGGYRRILSHLETG